MIPNSTVIVEEAKALPEESPTLFYFPAMEVEHTPELVFFEEKSIKESSWRKASEKGRQLWERLRERFEIYSSELFATDRFIRRLHAF